MNLRKTFRLSLAALLMTITHGVSANDMTPTEPEVVSREIELYATRWCAYCKKARKFFKQNKIDYVEYDIEVDKVAKQRHAELMGNDKTMGKVGVPLFVINEKVIIGYSEDYLKYELGITN